MQPGDLINTCEFLSVLIATGWLLPPPPGCYPQQVISLCLQVIFFLGTMAAVVNQGTSN
jgi:hypothetical protein